MNCYWSCWLSKDELTELGATGIISVTYYGRVMYPDTEVLAAGRHYCFLAEEDFPTFLKLKSDKSVAPIPERYYRKFLNSEVIDIDIRKPIGKLLHNCLIDF